MSRMGAKTYSRKAECRFDQLLAEKGNKPSTAKVSVSAVHRWGMTSYTSIRKTNGQKDSPPEVVEPVKRVKLEPKVTHPHLGDPFNFESNIDTSSLGYPSDQFKDSKRHDGLVGKLSAPRRNKFFKSSGESNVVGGTNAAKKNDFDALRLSVPRSWSNVKSAPNVHVVSDQKLPYHSVIEKTPIEIRSAIPLAPVTSKFSDASMTTYISPFTDSSNPVSEIYPEEIIDHTSLRQGYLHSDHLPVENTVEETLPSVDSSCVQEDYSVPSNSVIPDICRTYGSKTSEFDLLSKCDTSPPHKIIADVPNEDIQSVSVEPSNKAICDSSASTYVKEPCAQSSESVPCCVNKEFKKSYSVEEEESLSVKIAPTSFSQPESTEPLTKAKNYSRPKKIFNTSKKLKAVYNHRHWQSMKEEKDKALEQSNSLAAEFDEEVERELSPEIIQPKETAPPSSEPTNSIKCYKPVKELYTVVRNVKQAYQCHESGETQEFNDDIEYLLEGLQDCNGIGTRCLSVLGLATKCMGPAFRIHLRAHGTMPKIFSALQDAPSDPNLSLCTATLLFVLSQDRLTMDIEASTLSLMLQLLETDPDINNPERELDLILEDPALCAMQEKHREKVYQLCEQMQQKGHAKHLKLDNINTGILAMETLLSLTSRKAGEWFKEEIRLLHGLDHIVDTISSCVELLSAEEAQFISEPSESQMDKIRKIDRCLRVLENVTFMNCENQDYLLHYKSALVINYCFSLLKLCKSHLLENQHNEELTPTSSTDNANNKNVSPVAYCLLSVMKVLLNITFENPSGCCTVGSLNGFVENALICVLQVPRALPSEKRFDLLVLSLGVMINLAEHYPGIRPQIMELYVPGSFDTVNDGYELVASEALIEVLLSRLESARVSEEQADEILDSQAAKHNAEKKDSENAMSNAECLEETLMKTLAKAGKHMEHSMIAAYISLLLGCVIQNNQEYADALRDQVPDGKFDMMVDVLKKFMSFINLTGAIGNTGGKCIQRIIEVLSSS